MGQLRRQHPNTMRIYIVLIVALVAIGLAAANSDEMQDQDGQGGEGGKGGKGGKCRNSYFFETADLDTPCRDQVPEDESLIKIGSLDDLLCLNANGEPEAVGTEKCICAGIQREEEERRFPGKARCLTCRMTVLPGCE